MAKIHFKIISAHMSYTIWELSGQLRVNPKTVRRWIDDGLAVVSNSKNPILVMGEDVKKFLNAKRSKKNSNSIGVSFVALDAGRPGTPNADQSR